MNPSRTLLAHDVYFSLNEPSREGRERLIAACRKHLARHPGIVFFGCGALAEDLAREVNDRDFDVALHIVFVDQAAHDEYQTAPTHQQFVEENEAAWRKVRVFDSLITQDPPTA